MPCIIAIDVFFILGSDDPRRGYNAVQAFPELDDPSVRFTVSSAAFSPPPRARSRPLAASSAGAESSRPPAMLPSWLQMP